MDLFGDALPQTQMQTAEPVVQDSAEPIKSNDNTLATPKAMSFCLGHQKQKDYLLKLHKDNHLPHALILQGVKGIGKATFVYNIIKSLVEPSHQALVSSGAHPDILNIEPTEGKKNLEVEKIRQVNPFLHRTASMGGMRIVVIDDANTMNRNAQNALLKALEEPPKNTVIFLITHNLGSLIPTIKSRAQTLSFEPLNQDDFVTLLQKHDSDLSAFNIQILFHLSRASIGTAIYLIENNALEVIESLSKIFLKYPEWNWSEIHILAQELGRKGQENTYKAFEHILLAFIQNLLFAKAKLNTQSTPYLEEAFASFSHYNSSIQKLSKICEELSTHFNMIENSNLDKQQGVMGAFSILSAL